MRAYSEAAQRYFPQSVIVINRPGAIGTIGFDEGARAKPDGYAVTMLAAELLIAPYLKMGKSTYQDYERIGRLNVDPGVLVVRADAPWKNLGEFVADVKRRAGQVPLGTGGYVFRFAMASFEQKCAVSMNHVPYQGEAPAVLGLLSSQVDAMAGSPSSIAEFVRAGKLRILGVMSDKRLAGLPGGPTFKEGGLDFSAATWRGLAVPKGTPPAVLEELRQLSRRVCEDAAFNKIASAQEIGISFQDAAAFRSFLENGDAELKKTVPTVKLGQ